jgi:chromosome segregation ATPase
MAVRKSKAVLPEGGKVLKSASSALPTNGGALAARDVPPAWDAPASCGMLAELRSETQGHFERVDQRFDRVDQRFDRVDQRLDGMDQRFERVDQRFDSMDRSIAGVENRIMVEILELRGRLNGVQAGVHSLENQIQGVKAEIHEVKLNIHEVKADIHEVKALFSRMSYLMEEQNVRNRIVLEGLTHVIDRQDRSELRMDKVEETVRSLAKTRPAA